MKYAIFFFLSFLLPFYGNANKIDRIKSKKGVVKFLANNIESYYRRLDLFSKKQPVLADGIQHGCRSNSFYKVDIDGDGRTDLIVDGVYCFVVLDKGTHFEMHYLDDFPRVRYSFNRVLSIKGNLTGLILNDVTTNINGVITESKADTVLYQFGGFVEFNSNQRSSKISSVLFSSSQCFGECPVYSIEVSSDGSAKYNAIRYLDSIGEFEAVISDTEVAKLFNLLDYIKFETLKSEYRIRVSDHSTATLEIVFDDGKRKKISDYGECGTIGLKRVYETMYDLTKRIAWKKKKN